VKKLFGLYSKARTILKAADEDLVEVTGINTGTSGKDAVVEYTTADKNLTPFSDLAATNF